jgi:RHS repeat-associated protein
MSNLSIIAASGKFIRKAFGAPKFARRAKRRPQPFWLAERILMLLLWLLIIGGLGSSKSYAGYWTAGLPPINSGLSITCGDGIGCALENQFAWYGNPPYGETGCSYGYNVWGTVASASCCGKYGLPGLIYCGFAYPTCYSNETSTADGCEAGLPRDKDKRPCNCAPGPALGPASDAGGPNFADASGPKFADAGDLKLSDADGLKLSDADGPKLSNAKDTKRTGADGPRPSGANDLKLADLDDLKYVGDPVSATSGVKYEEATDFSTADGLLTFKRTYYSDVFYAGDSSPYGSRLGRGWTSNFDARLTGMPSGYVPPWSPPWWIDVRLPDGREIIFDETSGTNYIAWAQNPVTGNWSQVYNEPETITWNGTDWLLTLPDDSVYSFDTTGKLLSIQFRGGYTQTLTWDGNGHNTQVSDNLGRSLTFTYGANGLLSQLTDPDGNVFSYSYQDNSNTASYVTTYGITIDITNMPQPEYALSGVTNPDTTSVQYLYENTSFPYALTGVIDERGNRFETTTYDSSGRVATTEQAGSVQTYSFSYDDTDSQTTVTNPYGKTAIYHYNNNVAGMIQLTEIEGQSSSHTAAANTSFGYDSNGYVNQVTDGEGRVTQIVNDARGIPTSITRGYGTSSAVTTTYTLDSTFHVPDEIVEPNLTTDFTWNSSGQLTQVTQTDTTSQTTPYSTNGQTRTWAYTYTSTGGLLASVDGPLSGSGDTVSYTYNSSGFLQTVTDQVGNVTTFTAWNGRGQPTSMTDPNGVVTNLTYDTRGRLLTVTADASGIAAVTTIVYDGAGDITQITRPNGAYLQYTWDTARRLTAVQDNLGNSIQYTRDVGGNVTARAIEDPSSTLELSQTEAYDELGRLLTFVGSASQTWTHAYDKTNNRVSVTDPRSNVYQWAFDSLSRLISETNEDSATVNLTRDGQDQIVNYSDPRSLSTAYVRDGFADVIQRASPDSGITVYTYNALGKPTQITDGRGVVTNLTYDNAGRLLTKQYPAATAENITYTWDSTAGGNNGKGRITEIDDASGSVNWTYDTLGRITQEKKTTSGVVYTVNYTYDADGNIAQITYPSGRIVNYSRDSLGHVSGVTTKQSSSSSAVTLASGVAYEPFGALSSLTYGNGLALSKSFTEDYLINTLVVQDASTSTVVVNRSYAFGDSVNITAIADNLNSARSETYTYTASNRLQEGDGIWGTLTWSYDGVGNRASEALTSGSTTTSTYNYPSASNQLASLTQSSTTVRSFSYDGAGNLTADTRSSTAYNYAYNNRGRLAELDIGSTVTADYTYDGLERLAIRATSNMTPAGTTQYVYDLAGHLIAEADSSGNTLTEYAWLNDMPLALVANVDTSSPSLYFVHPDHLNRPIRMTDTSESVVWDAVYNPFGDVYSITGSASNNMRFPGQYFLIEDGLHYNWYRHYDPTIGRYVQPDPLGLVDGSAIYAYTKSAPISNVDPEGRQVIIVIPGQRDPDVTPVPPGVFDEWKKHAQAGINGLWNFCRRIISGDGGGGPDPDCKDEIREAREICTEAYANGWSSDHDVGPYSKPDGGQWTIQDCMRGLISERCGGNPTK